MAAEVLIEKVGRCMDLTMNRPAALNALNLNMVQLMTAAYGQAKKDTEVAFIMLRGSGGKAFCAGGDVRAIYDNGKEIAQSGRAPTPDDLVRSFFRQEYQLDYATASTPKPQVAIMDGITMGGGVGVSVHGKYRVATERSMFAMPETAIGFFPDVGGSYFLPRLPEPFGPAHGTYLALTGDRLKGKELKLSGIATHFVPSERLPALVEALHGCQDAAQLAEILAHFDEKVDLEESFQMFAQRKEIERCFSADSVEDVQERLRGVSSEWSERTLGTLAKMSPTSLKVSLEQVKRGAALSLPECLQMENAMAREFMRRNDFFEGVRSVLVDKDRNPKWSPASLDQVSASDVAKYFEESVPSHELLCLQ